MGRTGPTPTQFDKWKWQMFINIKKYKIVFKIRKDHLRKIFLRFVFHLKWFGGRFDSAVVFLNSR